MRIEIHPADPAAAVALRTGEMSSSTEPMSKLSTTSMELPELLAPVDGVLTSLTGFIRTVSANILHTCLEFLLSSVLGWLLASGAEATGVD